MEQETIEVHETEPQRFQSPESEIMILISEPYKYGQFEKVIVKTCQVLQSKKIDAEEFLDLWTGKQTEEGKLEGKWEIVPASAIEALIKRCPFSFQYEEDGKEQRVEITETILLQYIRSVYKRILKKISEEKGEVAEDILTGPQF